MSHSLTDLDELDLILSALRRTSQREGYRSRLLRGVTVSGGLTTLRVLRVVSRHDSPTVGEIAHALAVEPSTASRTVSRAVDAGHLTRQVAQADRRQARLALTAQGRELLDQVTENRRRMLTEVTADWTPVELSTLLTLLGRLSAGLDDLDPDS